LRIERLAGGNPELTNSGSVFYASMDPAEALVVQTITATAGVGFNPAIPFVISGSANAADGKQAVILDVRALPSGAIVQVDNVDFIAIVGAVRVIGGAGQNMASGDNQNQWIVLGADDDLLHGGGGKDSVGSLGGNDQVFGDSGNDIVFGGTGHDTLSGGTGNDRLDGGLGWDTALQAGSLADYTLSTDGQVLVFTHRTSGEVDRLKSIEQVKFDSGPALYIADSEAEAAVAHIATHWLGRAPTALEGAWAQENSGLTALQVAEVVLQAAPGLFPGRTAQELVAGLQDNAQIVRMDVIPELNQGSAGHDELRVELDRADVHLARTGTDRWEATSLIDGNMGESVGIERLHLKDVSVALDTQGTAGQVAGLLSVLLGSAGLKHQGLAGAGLAALDSGMSVEVLSGYAIDALQQQQGHAFAAQELVQLLWTNATGSAGTQQQLQPFVQQLQTGDIGAQELVSAAAQYALAHPSTELVGVLDSGLFYNAQG
ncbi:MAG: calcium-binding protein, partial [Comamonas sp.]